ncbi:hypothetical protein [Ancylobacter lacus]|uniref:hypothetical protein n=1 Tax=Ancylobacter lacus TaxID=2579970 RepID=UPI001BCB82A3|nr:hypothetical protein [Ancylobacter lacus]MBS7539750.1 hypothetical protein [Ancylobacter lacus]
MVPLPLCFLATECVLLLVGMLGDTAARVGLAIGLPGGVLHRRWRPSDAPRLISRPAWTMVGSFVGGLLLFVLVWLGGH